MPPDYSAVQIEGRRAYQMARAGQAVELAPRDVVIHEFTLLEWDASDPARPFAVTEVVCSAGTYIRALARDLGARLESGAYLGALVRTASGGFRLEDAIGFEALRDGAAGGPEGFASLLRPIDAGLEDLPHAPITADEIRRLGEGLITAPKTPLAAARRADRARRRARTAAWSPSAGRSAARSTRTRSSRTVRRSRGGRSRHGPVPPPRVARTD